MFHFYANFDICIFTILYYFRFLRCVDFIPILKSVFSLRIKLAYLCLLYSTFCFFGGECDNCYVAEYLRLKKIYSSAEFFNLPNTSYFIQRISVFHEVCMKSAKFYVFYLWNENYSIGDVHRIYEKDPLVPLPFLNI